MELEIREMPLEIDELIKVRAELSAWKQEYESHKQSLKRMSTRLRKLCKKLSPTNEIVLEMQHIADEIRELTKINFSVECCHWLAQDHLIDFKF